MEVRVITGCTPDYFDKAAHLQDSGSRNGVVVYIMPYEDQGSWIANTRYKPEVVRKAQERWPHDIVMWVDADGQFEASLPGDFQQKLTDGGQDVYAPFKGHVSANRKYYVGTLVFMPTPAAKSFVRVWGSATRLLKTGSDEWSFELARRAMGAGDYDEPVRFGILASRYAWVDGHGDSDTFVREGRSGLEGVPLMIGSPKNVVIRHGISGKATAYIQKLREEGRYDEHKSTV